MRNLKRALSLTLASVMLLGMMVVGGSAVGYPDVDKNDNVEAIEVLQAVGIMGGDNNGNFSPDDYVTREQMAVIMSQLLKLEYNYYKGTNPFSDVPEWAAPYVAACAANGITAGIGDGLYGSKQNIQAVQAALMMLKALGYFQYAGDYEGGYVLATVKQASEVGLFDGIDSESDADLTRNQVAQMVLNALKSEMVTFTGDPGITYTGSNGESWVGGYKAEYTPRTSTQAKYQAIERRTSDVAGGNNLNRGQYYIQLGEELYDGDLRLRDYQVDDFGRPARIWEYKGNEVGTYVKKELLTKEWTVSVSGKDLYDLLTKNTIDTYDFSITIDGETESDILGSAYFTQGNMVRTNTKAVGNTGKGVLTQVFTDPNEGEHGKVYVAIINTYLAIADSDYNERKEEASFTIHSISGVDSNKALVKARSTTASTTAGRSVKNEDINVEDVKKDDIVLVHVAENEIKEIITPEILSDKTISAFKLNSWVQADGTQYNEAHTAQYDIKVLNKYSNNNMKDVTYNIILDEYGYMIGIEQNEDPDQYVFITGNDGGASDLQNKEAEMSAIFLDGTMEVIKVDMKKSNFSGSGAIVNTWCTYTKGNNDVYTLREVSTSFGNNNTGHGQWAQNVADAAVKPAYVNANSANTYTIDKAHISLIASSDGLDSNLRVYGNDETVYINVSTDVITTKTKYTATAGNPATNTTPTGNGISDIKATPAADNSNYYRDAGTDVYKAVIIDDVESVTVGVKNVSMIAKDVVSTSYAKVASPAANNPSDWYAANELAVPKSEIYTLYDTDGYVIAAIVIGEDQGASSQYAYVHSATAKKEEYGHTGSSKAVEGKWSWERDVIIDGEVVTLTEVEDDNWGWISDDNMVQGQWYKISYDANGNVRKAENTSQFDPDQTRYSNNVGAPEDLYDENHRLVILEVNYTGTANMHSKGVQPNSGAVAIPIANEGHLAGGLSYENMTLYTKENPREGFAVSSDVKVIYFNAELLNGKTTADCGKLNAVDWFATEGETFTGKDAVEKVLKLIDSRSAGKFVGVLNAVIEDGVATSIIINDTYGEYIDRGGDITPTPSGYPNVRNNGGTLEVRYYGDVPSDSAIESLISTAARGQNVTYYPLEKLVAIGTGDITDRTYPISLIKVVAIKNGATTVGYVDSGVATNVTLGGFAASTAYIKDGTVKVATSSTSGTPDYTSNSDGKISFAILAGAVTSDLVLVPAYQVKVGTGVEAKVGTTSLYADATQYNLVPSGATVEVKEDATSAAADKNTSHTLKAGDVVIASKVVDADSADAKVKAAVSGTWTANANVTLSVVRGTKTVTINGTQHELTSENNAALLAKLDLNPSKVGAWMINLDDSTDAPKDMSSVDASALTAGGNYETGYFKVTVGSVSGTPGGGVGSSVTAPAADVYKKAGETVDITLTFDGTATGTTGNKVTVTNGTFSSVTIDGAVTNGDDDDPVASTDTIITFTAKATGTAKAVVKATVTLDGKGDVTFGAS